MDMITRTITTPQATPPMCSAMVLRSNCMRPPGWWSSFVSFPPWAASRQLEVHGHGHDDRHGDAVEEGRGVHPLLDGVDGGRVEQRYAAKDLHVGDLALGADGALQDHHALHPGLLRDIRIRG